MRFPVLATLLAMSSAEFLAAAPAPPSPKTPKKPQVTAQLGTNDTGLRFPQQPSAAPSAFPGAPTLPQPGASILQPAPSLSQPTVSGPALNAPAPSGPVRTTVLLPGGVEELPSPAARPDALAPPGQPLPPPAKPHPTPAPVFPGAYVPAPAPAAPAVYCPTIQEFAAHFRGIPGQTYDLLMVHPRTRRPVRVVFTLPQGHLRQTVADSTELRFVYSGGYELEVHFKSGGRVELDFDD